MSDFMRDLMRDFLRDFMRDSMRDASHRTARDAMRGSTSDSMRYATNDRVHDELPSDANRSAGFAASQDPRASMTDAPNLSAYQAAAVGKQSPAAHRLPFGRVARIAGVAALVVVAACRKDGADAYGNFEATEVTVAAEGAGRLLRLEAEEGGRITKGAEVGLIDTTALALQRDELLARRGTARARIGEVQANAALVESQQGIAARELERTRRLLAAQAATAQQEDRAERDVRVLHEQLQAARAAQVTATRDVASIDAQLASLDDRVRRSHVVAPETGTVLTRYVEPGELVQVGTPLFKMASLDTLTLRAYLSGAQLARVALGQTLVVRVDAGGDSLRTVEGRVTWISPTAEFTPTPIQTREERTTQVYAVKLAVPNADGRLRLGMPAEVSLGAARAGT